MIILPTDQAEHIGERMKRKYTNFKYISLGPNNDGKLEFADREQYTNVRNIEQIDGEDVLVLHCAAPRPNSSTLRLYHTLCSLSDPQYSEGKKIINGEEVKVYKPLGVKPKSIQVFFLYAPQCKQDWPDKTGSINAAKQVLDICKLYGAKRFFALDVHYEGEEWTRDYDIVYTSVIDLLISKAYEDGYRDLIWVAPDSGMARRARHRGIDVLSMKKTRLNSRETIVDCPAELKKILKGKSVGVIDDLLGTGGTMYKAGEKLKECEVEESIACVPHLRLTEGYKRIEEIFSDIYVSNSIKNDYSKVDITDRVAETIYNHA
ncbi:MAG: phosphoribosyltransferase family protein [Candidatus Aenigmatarchaeota archaeon]